MLSEIEAFVNRVRTGCPVTGGMNAFRISTLYAYPNFQVHAKLAFSV
jgi:hypothetical protein